MHRSRWRLAAFLGLCAWLVACGGEPVLPPLVGDPDGGVVPPGTFVPLTVGSTANGTVSSSTPRGYRIDLTQGSPYALVLEDVDLDVTATVYANADRTGQLGVCAAEIFSQACLMTLPAGPVFVEVSGSVFTSSFRMTLVPVVDEGDATTPVHLSQGSLASLHTVAHTGTSYFSFTTETSGGVALDLRTIDVVPSPSVAFVVDWFAGTDFAGTPLRSCTQYLSDCVGDDMVAGTYSIRITNTGGKPIVMHLEAVRSLSEGARVDPVPIALDTTHAGGFDASRRSFYSFTTSTHAGGYVFDFPAITPSYQVQVFENATATTPVSSCSSNDRCMLADLEANTAYLAVVTGSYGVTYDLLVSAGLSEGTSLHRIALVESTEHVGAVDARGTSRYSFTPTQSAYYDLVLPSTLDFFADIDVLIDDPENAFGVTSECWETPCRLGPLTAGVTYGIDVRSTGYEGSLPLTVVRETVGDGTFRAPFPLVVGQDRATEINAYYGNDYRLSTAGHAGPIGVVFQSSGFFNLQNASGSFFSECDGKADMQVCVFPLPVAGDAIDFYVRRSSASSDLRIHVFDLHPSAGCEADALRCFDFEGAGTTMPSEITEPATSGRAFSVSTAAANLGTYGIAAGTNAASSCFQLTTPAGSGFAAFDLDFGSGSASDSVIVAVDGTNVGWYSPSSTGFARHAVGFSPTSSHLLTLCLNMSGNGTRHAYVDDLELH